MVQEEVIPNPAPFFARRWISGFTNPTREPCRRHRKQQRGESRDPDWNALSREPAPFFAGREPAL